MKFYIGSSFKNADLINYFSDKLCEHGLIHTYNWAKNIIENETVDDKIDASLKEIEGIEDADIVIIIIPAGRGTHIEMGMALAFNKKIYMCAMDEKEFSEATVNFYELPEIIKLAGTPDSIIKNILSDCNIKY